MKTNCWNTLDQIAPRMKEIALAIGNRPELGHEELFASGLLTDELTARGFRVERGVLDIPTAFIAEYRSTKPGPVIAYLCEYDALPDLGHACGHHLICTMSMAASIALQSAIDQYGGILRVYGTPAEETSGAKVPMAAAGLFDDVDAAMMAHPYHCYEASGTSLAMDAVQYEFYGKAAHAAANPYEGVNALDAVIMLFNSISVLRQQLQGDARLHGIIADGGKAPNIIPDYACARFYIRSASRSYTSDLVARVRACAEGAALQTGCSLNISNYEFSYDELRTNEALSDLFSNNLLELGVASDEITIGQDHGSIDLGNVSLRCPAIHPYVKITDEHRLLHTPEFRDDAMKDRAFTYMMVGAKALAGAGYDLLSDPGKLATVREEWGRGYAR